MAPAAAATGVRRALSAPLTPPKLTKPNPLPHPNPRGGPPWQVPVQLSRNWRPAQVEGLPAVFTGGWVGYAGYDTVRYVYAGARPAPGAVAPLGAAAAGALAAGALAAPLHAEHIPGTRLPPWRPNPPCCPFPNSYRCQARSPLSQPQRMTGSCPTCTWPYTTTWSCLTRRPRWAASGPPAAQPEFTAGRTAGAHRLTPEPQAWVHSPARRRQPAGRCSRGARLRALRRARRWCRAGPLPEHARRPRSFCGFRTLLIL